jgi:hypothetical protein
VTQQSHTLIADYILSHPDQTWQEVAAFFDISLSTVSRIAKESGLSRPVGLDEASIASRVARGEEVE